MLANHRFFIHALVHDDFADSLAGTDLCIAKLLGALLRQDFLEERGIADQGCPLAWFNLDVAVGVWQIQVNVLRHLPSFYHF